MTHKALTRNDALARHRRTRHRIGHQYYCTVPRCYKSNQPFGRFDNYRIHLQSSHGILIASKSDYKGPKSPLSHTRAQRPEYNSPIQTDHSLSDPSLKDGDLRTAAMPALRIGGIASSSAPGTHVPLTPDTTIRPVQGREPVPAPPPSVPASSTPTVSDGLEDLNYPQLLQRLRVKIVDYQNLEEQCRIVCMERDEYIEALRLSEAMRMRLEEQMQND
ncbi:hypothetical protein GGR56DRAFT_394598 [Xylariaceae sp. FL0804]|nr:hypothetical protein GGR56DRAFT_394598 [Xylariaceae sp. FL0804]